MSLSVEESSLAVYTDRLRVSQVRDAHDDRVDPRAFLSLCGHPVCPLSGELQGLEGDIRTSNR